jgi:hypothetical protein
MMEWGYKRKMLDAGLYECGFLISDCRIKNQKYWIKRMRISDFGLRILDWGLKTTPI